MCAGWYTLTERANMEQGIRHKRPIELTSGNPLTSGRSWLSTGVRSFVIFGWQWNRLRRTGETIKEEIAGQQVLLHRNTYMVKL
ncbi:hypothetical protein LIER_24746 [Lithospermum erythrorhizon]|uniref:Uncharacterized protein n=1 Tax=Lithospermum erythrorhizon TaxID=34254 RepID=A0AAV3R3R9_LITER